jgi:uncharacterized integral membrane protein (TIGR00698 family)
MERTVVSTPVIAAPPKAEPGRRLPGILLCLAVTLAALLVQAVEERVFGRAWLEALVVAILIGTAVRSAWTPDARFKQGITFCAKTVLEIAVLLLGASISLQTIAAAGADLLLGIAGIVVCAVAASYGIGRAFGLPVKMAILVAAGNSICGNSAIAAVAPVIGASGKDVASSIAFTAVLGVVVVLLLPLAVPLLHMTELQYGVLAGLTVYAVPQVLAATAPVGVIAVQMGTLVKLVRVLMLGPLVTVLSVGAARRVANAGGVRRKMTVNQVVPWFILGFLALAGLRSAGFIPAAALPPVAWLSGALTIVSMAALGLGVDVRTVAKAGPAVTATVTLSLLMLLVVSLVLIRVLGVV